MLRDLRLAFRSFRKRRTYALSVALILAVGVGASTSIFAFVDAAVLQPPPFRDPSRLRLIWGVAGPERNIRGASFLEIKDWKERTRTLQDVVLYDNINLNVSIDGASPARVATEMVAAGYFDLLGATPAMGRVFRPDEDAVPDQHPVAVISDTLWRTAFAADPNVFNRRVLVGDRAVTIIGVMRPGFGGFSMNTDLWVPSMMMSLSNPVSVLQNRGTRWLGALTRFKDGVAPEAAQADLDRVAADLEKTFPETNTGRGAMLQTPERYYFGDAAARLRMLFGAVLLFLVVACSNVAALQLARSTSRRQETAVSLALGATRKHLARQLAAEAVVLGIAGALLGVLLASWMMSGLRALQPVGALPPFVEPALNLRAVGFASVIAFLSALIAGMVPAIVAPAAQLSDALRTSARAVRGGLGRIARPAPQQLLVIAQVAIAFALLVAASLVIKTLQTQLRVPLGFAPENVTSARVTLTGARYTAPARAVFAARLEEALRAVPGVQSVLVSDGLPFNGANASILVRQPDLTDRVRYYVHSVSPDYFRTLGMPLVAGSAFTGNERIDTPRVAIVTESGALRLFPNTNPIGKRFTLGRAGGPEAEIVGVVADARFRDLTADLRAPRAEPDVFFPIAQRPDSSVQMAVRTAGAAPSAEALQQIVASIDPSLPVYNVESLDERTRRQTANARFTSAIMGAFGIATLLLAGVGLYGLVAYVVSLSRREIALRFALGAERRSLIRLVVRNGITLVAAGIAAGLLLAWALRGAWPFWIGGTPPAADPLTIAAAVTTLLLAGGIAALVPALSAASVDPSLALRAE